MMETKQKSFLLKKENSMAIFNKNWVKREALSFFIISFNKNLRKIELLVTLEQIRRN